MCKHAGKLAALHLFSVCWAGDHSGGMHLLRVTPEAVVPLYTFPRHAVGGGGGVAYNWVKKAT